MSMIVLGEKNRIKHTQKANGNSHITGRTVISSRLFKTIMPVLVILVLSMTLLPTQSYASTVQSENVEVRQIADSSKNTNSQYMDIDATNLAQKGANGGGTNHNGGTFITNMTNMIQTVVNTLLLPISLVVLVARLMYIAIGPLMLGMDPFDVLDLDTWREGPQAVMRQMASGKNDDGSKDRTFGRKEYDWGGKGDWRVKLPQEQITHIMKQELIGTGKALLIIIIIWAVINMILWSGGYLLNAIQI